MTERTLIRSSFTLERYGHVLDQGIGPRGFEY